MPKAEYTRATWQLLARVVAPFLWALLTEAAFISVGVAEGYFRTLPDEWPGLSMALAAIIGAMIGLPFSIAVLAWRFVEEALARRVR